MGLAPLAGAALMPGPLPRLLLLLLAFCASPLAQAAQHHLLVVAGIGGTDAYRHQFAAQSARLYRAALAAGLDRGNVSLLGEDELPDEDLPWQRSGKPQLLDALGEIGARAKPGDRVFVVLIGHGNPRGDDAAFNLPGPDITGAELAAALESFAEQQVVVVNTASASGPFVGALSAPGRVVITATQSGREYHATLFGEYFVAAFAEPGADTDKDERISLLEAFDYARREVRRAYEAEKKLLTEHALLDDNGDGEGSRVAGEFEADGALAHRVFLEQPPAAELGASPELVAMIERKQALEAEITELKRGKDTLPRDDYYARLERLLVELARLSRDIRDRES